MSLTLNGQKTIVKTHAATVNDILAEFEITAKAEDYIHPSKDRIIKDGLEVEWRPAQQVKLNVDGKETVIWTTAKKVEGFLSEQKLDVAEHDKLSLSKDTKIEDNMQIAIEKAFPIKLVVGGSEQQVWSTSTTVADFLRKQGVGLNELDRVEPQLAENVQPQNIVNVIRIEKVTDVVEEPVQFATITKKDHSLHEGKEKVISEGKNGLLSKQFEVTKENGKEVARALISEKVVTEKTDKVVAVGTKQLVAQVSRGEDNSQGSGREIYVSSTAYTAGCNGCSGTTATGINLKQNPNAKVIAVDPNIIPLGTKVYVEGYGYAVAADKGGAIKGHKIDVFFPSKSDAYRWGVKKVKIRVLN
ncbi:ubiquitin-like domain-containing protein [Peribacillus loiseleuriae]|uniref:ubiquitin-like domain-containing protein n=1 Tax=Peribacillus loiseleuriae TaxID=1679170 RepID=UPI0037FA2604